MLVHSHADSYVPIKDSISKQVEKMLCPDVKWEKKKKKKERCLKSIDLEMKKKR